MTDEVIRRYPSDGLVRKIIEEYTYKLAAHFVASGAVRVDVIDIRHINGMPEKRVIVTVDMVHPGDHIYQHQLPFRSFDDLADRLKENLYDKR